MIKNLDENTLSRFLKFKMKANRISLKKMSKDSGLSKKRINQLLHGATDCNPYEFNVFKKIFCLDEDESEELFEIMTKPIQHTDENDVIYFIHNGLHFIAGFGFVRGFDIEKGLVFSALDVFTKQKPTKNDVIKLYEIITEEQNK